MSERQVKVLKAKFSEKYNVALWVVQDIKEKKELLMAWNPETLRDALGLEQDIPVEAIKQFCDMMIGKEFKWISQGPHDEIDVEKIRNGSLDYIRSLHDELDIFPFYEIQKILQEDSGEIKDIWEQ